MSTDLRDAMPEFNGLAGTPNLAAALAKFQGAVGTITKNKKAQIGTQYSYQYADLASIAEQSYQHLSENGLSFTASPTMGERGFVLEYALLHESGEAQRGTWPLPDPLKVDIKQIGIAITYARRYCFSAVTGIVTEEDTDTQGAPAPQQEQVGRPRPPQRRQQEPPGEEAGGWSQEHDRRRQKRMFALFNELNIKDRDAQIAWCTDAIDRDLTTRTDMTPGEVEKVIASLEAEQKARDAGPMFPEPKVDHNTGEVER